jgi:hypothetical protein
VQSLQQTEQIINEAMRLPPSAQKLHEDNDFVDLEVDSVFEDEMDSLP